MNKYNQSAHIKSDYFWIDRQPMLTRLAVQIFRSRINTIVKHVLTTAFERNSINSRQLNELAAIVDRILYPQRYDNAHVSTQENIVCGGDVAGRDINK